MKLLGVSRFFKICFDKFLALGEFSVVYSVTIFTLF